MATDNIYDEATQKLKTEQLNLSNIISNYIVSDNENKVYEILEIQFLKKYYRLLNENVSEMEFDPLFVYKPEYASYKIYGTSSYDYLILHANKMTSKKQFKPSAFANNKFKYYYKGIIDQIASECGNAKKQDTKTIEVENYLLYNI